MAAESIQRGSLFLNTKPPEVHLLLEQPSGFVLGTPELITQCPNHYATGVTIFP